MFWLGLVETADATTDGTWIIFVMGFGSTVFTAYSEFTVIWDTGWAKSAAAIDFWGFWGSFFFNTSHVGAFGGFRSIGVIGWGSGTTEVKSTIGIIFIY
jgi:hypothetical protein